VRHSSRTKHRRPGWRFNLSVSDSEPQCSLEDVPGLVFVHVPVEGCDRLARSEPIVDPLPQNEAAVLASAWSLRERAGFAGSISLHAVRIDRADGRCFLDGIGGPGLKNQGLEGPVRDNSHSVLASSA
jgi:hypothetical protein